jgi:DNA polymerase V
MAIRPYEKCVAFFFGFHIIIAVVNGELLVKHLRLEGTQPYLVAEHPDYPDLKITEAMEFQIWGVVTSVIHSL